MERGPNKRKIKPSSNPEWIHLDDFENESSSDSDFCIEDHSESDSDGASYTEGLLNIYFIYCNVPKPF